MRPTRLKRNAGLAAVVDAVTPDPALTFRLFSRHSVSYPAPDKPDRCVLRDDSFELNSTSICRLPVFQMHLHQCLSCEKAQSGRMQQLFRLWRNFGVVGVLIEATHLGI
jgi:hypothetical protein